MADVTIRGRAIAAAILDTDGVVTDTATVHAEAWKDVFDDVLRRRARQADGEHAPFTRRDYLEHVDGVPRYDGVRRFFASRGIDLPEGDPSDPPDRETVCGIGNRKNEQFLERLRREGAPAYPGTVALLRWLREHGVALAVISSSRNMREVLAAAGVEELFDAHVDGVESARLELPGKPDPAIFLEAAARVGTPAADAMLVEDALSGVEAGRAGGFGLVVGVDGGQQRDALSRAGADVVVEDLTELLDDAATTPPPATADRRSDQEAT